MTDFWNTPEAVERNRRDTILKQLEIRALSSFIRSGMRILDVGCGDGETLLELAHQHAIRILGVDSSDAMLGIARRCEDSPYRRIGSRIDITKASAAELGSSLDVAMNAPFDLIYTERCLINLRTWEAQSAAIRDICSLLELGGRFVMCEHSQDGLDQCNEWRAMLKLSPIPVPSFNRYIRDDEALRLHQAMPGLAKQECLGVTTNAFMETCDFAGTYYFMSRIVNAKVAADAGQEPDYDAPINKLALDLPLGTGPNGFRGYSRIWAWRKA